MNILLLAGGESGERAVSLSSSASIYAALTSLGHGVKSLDPFTGQELVFDGKALAMAQEADLPSAAPPIAHSFVQRLFGGEFDDIDVVFLGLHGGVGENGSIQNMLELAGLTYIGSGVNASAVCMNKAITKEIMRALPLATPDWELLCAPDPANVRLTDLLAQQFHLPFIIKPNDGGSTVGLTKVGAGSEIPGALEAALGESDNVLVEEYIEGRELTVGLLDGEALPVVEIIPVSGLYDYEAKYTKGKSNYVVPADIDAGLADEMQKAASRLYKTVGCAGAARVDFILSPAGRSYCLEINTLPGMTELSLVPMAAQAVGLEFEQLVDKILTMALGRQEGHA